MKNISKTKKMFNFSINENLREEFIELAQKKSINKSNLLSTFIKNWVEENKIIK